MKRFVLMVTVALVMAALAAAPALAQGTPQGQVERGPEHANSICSFSGLNDEPEAEFPEGGQVQSYGQLVSQGLKAFVPSPGEYCNAHLYPYPPGPPPPPM
jgi:hypothetical protein